MPKLLQKVLVLVLITTAGVLVAQAAGYQAFRLVCAGRAWTSSGIKGERDSTDVKFRRNSSASQPGSMFEITQVQYSGETYQSTVTLPELWKGESSSLKERALALIEMNHGFGSSTNFVIGYIAPDTLDGQPVDRDAVIKKLPKPRFWQDEYGHLYRTWNCNVMVQVTLDLSGKVSNVTRVNDRPVTCDKESDVIEAAHKIKFDPATRNGVLVTQRQLFLYRLH